MRVLHLSYVGNGYRYQVMDVETDAVGWIDPEGLEPLETKGETDEDGARSGLTGVLDGIQRGTKRKMSSVLQAALIKEHK